MKMLGDISNNSIFFFIHKVSSSSLWGRDWGSADEAQCDAGKMSFKYLFTISYTPHFFASVYGWYEEINTVYNNEIIHRTRTDRSNSTHVEEINPRIDRWARAWKIANNRPQLLSSFRVRNRKKNSNSSLVRALDIYGLLSQSFNFDTINYSYSVIYWIVLHIKVDMSMWKGELDCCGNSFCCSAFFSRKRKLIVSNMRNGWVRMMEAAPRFSLDVSTMQCNGWGKAKNNH